jgi:hypothetical protein
MASSANTETNHAKARPVKRTETKAPARGEVRGRDGQVLTRNRNSASAINQYYIPDRLKEDGWSLQWIRQSCYNKEDRSNLSSYSENGWSPVPGDRPGFKELFGAASGEAIIRDGLMLVERPAELTRQAKEEEHMEALQQRNPQVEEFALSELPPGFRRLQKGDKWNDKIRRELEGVPESTYPRRELADIGDDD